MREYYLTFCLRDKIVYDGRLGQGLIEAVDAVDDHKDFVLSNGDYENFTCQDGLSGKELPEKLTVKARHTEITRIYGHTVYSEAPLKEFFHNTGDEAVGTKLVEVSKWDEIMII